MDNPPQKQQTIGDLGITRSLQDRIFLGVMGLIFMVPTGFVLYKYYTNHSPSDASTTFKALYFFLSEIGLLFFLLALCSFIWGIAAPRWIEQMFFKTIRRLVWILAFVAFVLLVLVGYILYLNV
jgi:hypothetical protein